MLMSNIMIWIEEELWLKEQDVQRIIRRMQVACSFFTWEGIHTGLRIFSYLNIKIVMAFINWQIMLSHNHHLFLCTNIFTITFIFTWIAILIGSDLVVGACHTLLNQLSVLWKIWKRMTKWPDKMTICGALTLQNVNIFAS